jgi:hypothetical protein
MQIGTIKYKADTQKHTHLQAAASQRTAQSLQKSVLFCHPKRNSNFFSPSLRCFNFFATAQPDTTKTVKLNIDNGLQGRTDRTPAGNSGFASCGVTVVNSSVVFQFNFSAQLTVLCPEIPHERKAAKRYVAF